MIDLMFLYVLLNHDFTMYAIHKRIQEYFKAYTNPSFGAIKPALVRLEKNELITSSKVMSNGGKLSVFYAITSLGKKELRELILSPISTNALQFFSDSRIKLSCISFLDNDDIHEVCLDIKSNALLHRTDAEKILEDEYTPLTVYQKIILNNTICEYNNLLVLLEGIEKENACNS